MLRQDLGDEISEDAAQDLEFIGRAAHRMDRLINDLLSLSRAGRKPIRVEELELQDCLQDALDALSAALSETQAEVRRDDLPMVVGDRTLITQVYQNLIANSLKFAPAGERPCLRATAEIVAGSWEFGVRDNGIGIDPDHAERVFQPFERLHGLSEYDGSGLGLAICRRAIERLGGRIWVAPESCQGAHVKFTLPLQREADRV
jgi:signal transduction histidine kinase